MLCQKCGAELQDNAAFCMECGSKVERKTVCQKCGAELQENAVFCMECGTKVNEVKEPVVNNTPSNPEAEYFGDNYVKITGKYWGNPFYKLIRDDLTKYTAKELFAIMYDKAKHSGVNLLRGHLGVLETKEFYDQLRLAQTISIPISQMPNDEDIAFLYISTDKDDIAYDVFMITENCIYTKTDRYLLKDINSLTIVHQSGCSYYGINGKPVAKAFVDKQNGEGLFNCIAEVYLLLVNKGEPVGIQESNNRLKKYIKSEDVAKQNKVSEPQKTEVRENNSNKQNSVQLDSIATEHKTSLTVNDSKDEYDLPSDVNHNIPRKSRILTGLLALFLGGIGAHKFYLGKKKWGIIYLLFCWTWIPLIMGILSGVKYLLMSDRQFEDKFFVRVN